MVPVQGGELLPVVPGEGVPGAAVVSAHAQPVEVGLGLHAEAGVLREGLASGPVLQRHQQLVRALVGQPVDVLQAQPVLAVNVSEPLLWGRKKTELLGMTVPNTWFTADEKEDVSPPLGPSRGLPTTNRPCFPSICERLARCWSERAAGHV